MDLYGCSKQLQFGLMSPGEVVKTGELNVYQGQLFHVSYFMLGASLLAKCIACNAVRTEPELSHSAVGRQKAVCWWPTGPTVGTSVTSRQLCSTDTQAPPQSLTPCLQGISNKAAQCQTCGQSLVDCTGHFGMWLGLQPVRFHLCIQGPI